MFDRNDNGDFSHSEGEGTIASGCTSHAEGFRTTAAIYSHAEGGNTKAINIVDIDAYVPGMIELTAEEIADYRMRVAALIC